MNRFAASALDRAFEQRSPHCGDHTDARKPETVHLSDRYSGRGSPGFDAERVLGKSRERVGTLDDFLSLWPPTLLTTQFIDH